MKFWIRIILLTIFDFAIIWLWIKQMNPDPSISIGILILVPFVVILNLIIALILYFTKREFVSLFVVNSIIAGILMFYLFGKGIDRYQNERLEIWSFKLQNTTYVITHWKLENTFSMSETNNPGSSTVFLNGKFIKKGNEYYLTTDTTEFIIKNEYFYKFRTENDSIKLTKIER
ncbi:hypothetical protein [Chryseobacterium turcicum]|uniref:Uncharacterized protein n=1 Tax=Chryseobacterium turcicum TaxID=2898076 RepID=A0A9Q3V2L0_9FLAO|nr:hypothetical protein [Chryseobacterium turcicum]MCD1118458.1 hypothetical protein [Chryseobacterium turcicum]